MAKFSRGQNFSDSPPGNELTAAALHALIENAAATTGFITELTEISSIDAAADYLLVFDASGNILGKAKPSALSNTPSIVAAFRNLKLVNNSGSPTTSVDITAAEAVLKDGSNVPKWHSGISVTANVTTTGAGGRDGGSEAPNTWYFIFLISDGTSVSSLLSISPTGPTMPGSYVYKLLVGAAYNGLTSDFVRFVQFDRRVYRARWASGALTNATINNDPTSATGYSALSIPDVVPSIATAVHGYAGSRSDNPGRLIVAGDTNGIGAVALWGSQDAGAAGANRLEGNDFMSGPFVVPLITAQTFQWKHAAAHTREIFLNGFELPL
jgi:hypothetical protein